MTFRIDSDGGQIGRFWWDNSGQNGLFLPYGQFFTKFRPGRFGWNEAWPDETAAWPVFPWGKGDPVDEHYRQFAAFEPWFYHQLAKRGIDLDFNVTEEIEMFAFLAGVFHAGIDAGRNPWRWARDVDARLQRDAEAVDQGVEQAVQQILQHADEADLSPQDWAKAFNKFNY